MPEKQPFDHRRHLLSEEKAEETPSGRPTNRGSTTNDDEALARILQEEILEEERRREQSSHGRSSYSSTPSTNYGASSRPGGPKPPPQQNPSNDMEMIMRLQQQEAAARSVYSAPSNYTPKPAPKPPPPPDTSNDMELLMRLQREEMDNLRSNRGVDDMELARRMQHEEALGQMQSDYQDQLNYARRIQEKALNANANRQNHTYGSSVPGAHNSFETPTGYSRSASGGRGSSSAVGAHNSFGNPTAYGRSASGGSGSSTPRGAPAHNRAATTSGYPLRHEGSSSGSGTPRGSSAHDSDLELARRMQELEERGMGRMNSDRELSNQRSQPATASRPQPTTLSQQEEEDARLARMLSESGQSLRDLHVTATPAPAPAAPPPMPKPNPIPAAPAPKPAPKIQKAVPVPQVAIPVPPQNASPTTSAMAKNMRRMASRSPKRERGVAAIPQSQNAPGEVTPTSNRKKNNFGSLFNRNKDKDKGGEAPISSPKPKKPTIPAPIPPRPEQRNGPLPYSSMGSRDVSVPTASGVQQKKKMLPPIRKQPSVCAACQKPTTSFLIALDKKYHAECFKCAGCYQVIDSTQPFAYMTDESGTKHPLHRKCYAELYGVKCAVCKKSIPAGPDGKVSFVKHPFFDKEQMCPRHAQNPGRRCTGCHRFEPHGEPFADLNDAGRCVCYSCCRSVVVDSADAQPLWGGVVDFFENKLHLPIWKDMRKVPILCVGYEALNDQMIATGATHGGSSQIMTRGLCLTEHQSGRKMKLAKLKFNKNNYSFEACDVESKGFTFFQVPDASKVNPDASVTAIICLSGLPRDLSASVLAHEATHAWIKLHPQFDISYPIPPQVEEGCAQLVAMLFLTEGLMPASTETFGDTGPSDAKLRQYFKFSIETDDHEIYGEGYRKAAAAYANIGIEALLSHVVLYKDFPKT